MNQSVPSNTLLVTKWKEESNTMMEIKSIALGMYNGKKQVSQIMRNGCHLMTMSCKYLCHADNDK